MPEEYKPKQFPKSLQYPLTLSAEDFYPDCICFTIMKRTGVSLSEISGAAMSSLGVMAASLSGGGFEFSDSAWMQPETTKKLKELSKSDKPDKKKRDEMRAVALADWKASQAKKVAEVNAKNKALAEKEGWDAAKIKAETREVEDLPENLFGTMMSGIDTFLRETSQAKKDARARGHSREEALRNLKPQKQNKSILGSIYMNMPTAITFNEKANWSGSETGIVTRAVKEMVGGGAIGETMTGAAVGGIGTLAAGGVTGIGALAARMGLKGGMIAGAVGAAAAGSDIQKGATHALGMASNPYMEMMFSGISFREFQFDFIMRPRSSDEFKEVDSIVKMFREHTKPSWMGGSLGKSFMNYPMEFNIKFLTTTGGSLAENEWVPRLKTCVCSDVTTNYAPDNMWVAHQDGQPVSITLGLHFQETELVMAADVAQEKHF